MNADHTKTLKGLQDNIRNNFVLIYEKVCSGFFLKPERIFFWLTTT